MKPTHPAPRPRHAIAGLPGNVLAAAAISLGLASLPLSGTAAQGMPLKLSASLSTLPSADASVAVIVPAVDTPSAAAQAAPAETSRKPGTKRMSYHAMAASSFSSAGAMPAAAGSNPPAAWIPPVASPIAVPPSIVPRTLETLTPVSRAAEANWGRGRFVYRAESKRLADVLQDFAASQGIPAVVADGVDGIVNANFDAKPREFLDSVARAYNMLWYHDGSALYFYPGRAIQSRMFRIKGFSREQLMGMLQSLDVGDKRYPIRFDAASSTIYVSGPPRHVELVSSALEALDAGVTESAERTVRVYPLQFASASDRAMGDSTVPGVAATLRKLYGKDDGDGLAASRATTADTIEKIQQQTRKKMSAYVPVPSANQFLPPLPRANPAEGQRPPEAVSSPGAGASQKPEDAPPRFEADEGTNSVVVYGRADRMDEYEALIRRLDQRPQLVELEATIIEVNSDSVDALGVNWSMRAGTSTLSTNLPGPSTPAALGTIVLDAGRHLLANVNALQAQGKARILSKPSVLGVANRAAVMREKRVATVRVAGNLEANLFQIEAGTLLQMTPQVTAIDGTNNIKLTLYIEDGAFETNVVDQIPVVKKTEIRTEAHVREGESLLIGGITVETENTQDNAVPGLSKLPVVGAAFRNTERLSRRTERLFLITPRVLAQNAPSTVSSISQEVRKP
ncbi:type III secretion system outer membrane ring subunit SctC [Paracidovorax konjaci]|uniref:Type 3 secretion system secretin n=1 Tax=Paracidovorax konjaci TaxID=32040 RepID=A0A1I1V5F0_9BURK|nr:type III secretion system outer membrane ring subunit SctC [Paracidovorax konjaci]SFD78257.1 type III secretion protein C [Paracidovorax konjaci]